MCVAAISPVPLVQNAMVKLAAIAKRHAQSHAPPSSTDIIEHYHIGQYSRLHDLRHAGLSRVSLVSYAASTGCQVSLLPQQASFLSLNV